MTILHLVHEGNGADLASQDAGFLCGGGGAPMESRRKRCGDEPHASALAGATVAPLGVVVHELRGGVAAPPH